jgi:hypothetical protein
MVVGRVAARYSTARAFNFVVTLGLTPSKPRMTVRRPSGGMLAMIVSVIIFTCVAFAGLFSEAWLAIGVLGSTYEPILISLIFGFDEDFRWAWMAGEKRVQSLQWNLTEPRAQE